MGAPQPGRPAEYTVPTPAIALRESLAEHRRNGIGFNQAWLAAFAYALRTVELSPAELDNWESVLDWAEPAFRRAYERQAPELEVTITQLAETSADAINLPPEELELVLLQAEDGKIAA